MNLEDLIIGQARVLSRLLGPQQSSRSGYEIGQAYLIRTVTNYILGRVVDVTDHEIVVEDASWVADTGRWHEALRDGASVFAEVEAYPPGRHIVGRGAVADAALWSHSVKVDTK